MISSSSLACEIMMIGCTYSFANFTYSFANLSFTDLKIFMLLEMYVGLLRFIKPFI